MKEDVPVGTTCLLVPSCIAVPASVGPAPLRPTCYHTQQKRKWSKMKKVRVRDKKHINQEDVTSFCPPNVRHFSPGRVTSAVLSPCWQVSVDEKEGQRRCQRVPRPVPSKRVWEEKNRKENRCVGNPRLMNWWTSPLQLEQARAREQTFPRWTAETPISHSKWALEMCAYVCPRDRLHQRFSTVA